MTFTKNNQIWLGKKHSPETIAKMRLAKTGKNNPMYGKETSAKQKNSVRHTILTQRSGENSNFWKGGIRKAQEKYHCTYMPSHPFAHYGGYVPTHRLIMEKKLGRYLQNEEVVHHIDGNIHNNKPENLAVMSKGQHIKLHRLQEKINNKVIT